MKFSQRAVLPFFGDVYYGLADWLVGDPNQPPPNRQNPINAEWAQHLYNRDVISMPDDWEYSWYASWDLAFHLIALAKIDPNFAKDQAILFLREWYTHPNGALPAYEYDFSGVTPPLHAWACWRVYKLTTPKGARDRTFLERVFQKLLLNFTWWVNRKDAEGRNIFNGGFLGMDNIGVFDRSKPLPTGGSLQQADATAWMAFYCTTMLAIALELAAEDEAYEDIASKFFEHFVAISAAMNRLGGKGLWDETDGFYYDQLKPVDGQPIPLRVRSLVGLVPLLAVEVLDRELIGKLPGFSKRMRWLLDNRLELRQEVSCMCNSETHDRLLLAIPSRDRLERVLSYLLAENEFLSPYGIRSVSQIHRDYPYSFWVGNQEYKVAYESGESSTRLFGGNSNWRGPIWFPLNYLLVEALERYYHFYGDDLQVECPTGSRQRMNLRQVADAIATRLTSLFLPNEQGRCPWHGAVRHFAEDPNWRDLVLFHEYFDGDTGRGLGASHQTGWTALVARFLINTRTGIAASGSEAPRIFQLTRS